MISVLGLKVGFPVQTTLVYRFAHSVTGAGENSFLFITLSLINHSCAPNVYLDDCDGSGHEVKVIATKAISKGEEVTHCYTREFKFRDED